MTPPLPVYTFDEILRLTEGLRRDYPDDLALPPIDLETFADLRLGLYIDEAQGLADNSVIASAILDDFTRIVIDSTIFANENTARFYLAHELGHYFLHREHFKKYGGEMTKEEWIAFATSEESRAAEMNANTFARLLLIPKDAMMAAIKADPRPSISELTRLFGTRKRIIELRLQDPDIRKQLEV